VANVVLLSYISSIENDLQCQVSVHGLPSMAANLFPLWRGDFMYVV
jgi:hypothetical protein